jgi:hypothetical protein
VPGGKLPAGASRTAAERPFGPNRFRRLASAVRKVESRSGRFKRIKWYGVKTGIEGEGTGITGDVLKIRGETL